MDWLTLIGGGLVIGVMLAAPIGPVNLICIRRTLAYGPLNGFLAGLGAALGDGIFAIVAGFGLTAAAEAISGMSFWIQSGGAVLLMIYGIAIARADPHVVRNPDGTLALATGSSLAGAMGSAFALTVTNPATLVGVAAFFAGMKGLVDFEVSWIYTGVLVASVIGGSTLWWFVVTTVTGLFHGNIETDTLRVMNRLSGVLILLTGVVFLGLALWDRFLK